MFKFVYAPLHDEPFPELAELPGFAGVEARLNSADPGAMLGAIGNRVAFEKLSSFNEKRSYVVVTPPPNARPHQLGGILREAGERLSDTMVLVENAVGFRTAAQLWALLESAAHPRVKVAWNTAAAIERPALVVPTLNLRIGLVRLQTQDAAEVLTYARRLAGVGYEGWLVIDLPAGVGEDRKQVSIETAAHIRDALALSRPVKKTEISTR